MENYLQKHHISYNSLELLFTQAPVAMSMVIGKDFIIENANPQILDLWGRDSTIVGKPLFEALPEIKSQGFLAIFEKVFQTGEVFQGNKWPVLLNKFGVLEEHFFNFIYAPIHNVKNEIIGVSIVGTEVTEQVLSEIKLRESEYRFEDLIRQADYSIAIYRSPELFIDLANEPMLRTWGKEESVIGMKLEEALPELEGQPFIGILKNIFKTGDTYKATEDRVDLVVDGILQTFYYNFSYKPLKDSSGNVYAILNMAVNVTDLVKAKKEVEKSEQIFKNLADSMPQFVWMADHAQNILYRNEQWKQFTGFYDNGAMKELSMVRPELQKEFEKAWHENLNLKQAFELEVEFRTPNSQNKYRWFLSRAVPLFDENQNLISWIGTFTDIDEFKQLQKQKDNFLGIASHELKTPLTSLKIYAQVLQRNLLQLKDQKNTNIANKIDMQVEHLSSLVGDLLDVTKIQNGKLDLNYSFFDFNMLIKEVVETQQLSAKQQIIFEPTTDISVKSDRSRLAQVMTNLIINAVKYSPASEKIIVTATETAHTAIFSIKDFGIGIAEDKQKHIFEQYYRVTGDMHHTFSGLGLGLYISSEIIKRLKGNISVISTLGKGSDFCFEIPKNRNSEK